MATALASGSIPDYRMLPILSSNELREKAMKRLCALACALCFGLGCATEEFKKGWEDALADWNGENMKMTTDFSGTNRNGEPIHTDDGR